MRSALLLALVGCLHCLAALACDADQIHHGCKIYGSSCLCNIGCKNEYIYKSRAACLDVLRERSSNACYRAPCGRGVCIQTAQATGYTCKCDGTGFYGQRCEKACPAAAARGHVFPHECVVI